MQHKNLVFIISVLHFRSYSNPALFSQFIIVVPWNNDLCNYIRYSRCKGCLRFCAPAATQKLRFYDILGALKYNDLSCYGGGKLAICFEWEAEMVEAPERRRRCFCCYRFVIIINAAVKALFDFLTLV